MEEKPFTPYQHTYLENKFVDKDTYNEDLEERKKVDDKHTRDIDRILTIFKILAFIMSSIILPIIMILLNFIIDRLT